MIQEFSMLLCGGVEECQDDFHKEERDRVM